ncbi:MAG: LysR family transcriptional regulator [Burkholderiaceae bacterium]|nr:LysR family transcriptional regulator [Burkholderiaceae bacterium]
MQDIDLKSLRLFVAVCDHRNIRLAAQQEHIEPSAISKRIAQLESLLKTPILVRSRRGAQPTPAGEALLEHARSMLFTMERIEADAAAFAGGIQGHVRLVASTSAIAESLLEDIAAFMRDPANRAIRVDIEERMSRDVVRLVREGNASIGVCWDSVDFGGLEHLPYRADELALAVHQDHPLAHRRSVRFEETLAYEHVGLPPVTAVPTMLHQAAARAGRAMSYRVVVSSFDAALRVVAAGLGVAVIPVQVAGNYSARRTVRVIPLSNAWARRRFAVCFRIRAGLSPSALRMVDHLALKGSAVAGDEPADDGPGLSR